jgi:hypothetical protein
VRRPAPRPLFALALFAAVASSVLSGCAHTMIVETEPAGAVISINGKVQGEAPVISTQFTSTGGRLYVTAEADNYETTNVIVAQSEWFLWPAIIAITPALAVPFVVIPFIGPVITIGWALVTSPTLLSLVFLQKYPERVRIVMKPKLASGMPQPTDTWLIPEDYDPNPPPLPPLPDPAYAPPRDQPPQPEGGNPVP